MRTMIFAALMAALIPAAGIARPGTAEVSNAVAKVLTDPARRDDRPRDAQRRIGAIMTFAQVRPGQKVLELIPGSGYFTRVFSGLVGPRGHVYVVWPQEYLKEATRGLAGSQALAAQPHYANITALAQPAAALTVPAPVDLVFTSQNYHDYPDAFMGKVDPAVLNREVFAALKPGGLYVIIDHVAAAGSGLRDTDTLHRIDPAAVKTEVEAAGFVFDGESQVLRNPADSHALKVFDKSIRGHTDQFIYRFRKPLR
ncbi:class I SAM-dependent methyltransferase [Frateuria aurantia]|uniref:Putative methyltransferase n=1 Tax=Frateuria aurantia (strain ATCC 33424 / DSM 6220 / KCTC 2777 / LMG 1558 / NBRC 3245 / NCIMB 13370) TaxID=767434 RepID=H8L2F4_FRAAD|nr:class I SAM-dependent methyltransferase [Frateuria aurantia]AFC84788.1 putative methyltransferase [Frateuria aurantia DSM 6220]